MLLIDEIDALIGDTLLSVLRQLRAGYDERPAGFPQSVILCGVRDVRDYRIRSTRDNAIVTGGSAFNVKAVGAEAVPPRTGRRRSADHDVGHVIGRAGRPTPGDRVVH